MPLWSGPPIRDRHDRHVRHARLSVAADASAARIEFMLKEALRLTALFGEEQGRAYYFRRVNISGLPPDANRAAWMGKFQGAMEHHAALAVHGSDPRARFAEAIFFHREQEGLELLFHRLLARQAIHEWFWPAVASRWGASRTASVLPTIVDVIEVLRSQPASWAGVSAILLTEPELSVVRLLQDVTADRAQSWLSEIEGGQTQAAQIAIDIPWRARPALAQALRMFGVEHPGAVWLATMAILLDHPWKLSGGTAVHQARHALQRLVEDSSAALFTGDAGRSAMPSEAHRTGEPASVVSSAQSLQPDAEASAERPQQWERVPDPASWLGRGVVTDAGGLLFLLNVFEHIGLSDALDAGLRWAAPDLPVRTLRRLAAAADVPAEDPMVVWLDSLIQDAGVTNSGLVDAAWWPSNLSPSRKILTLEDLVRVWSLAARRWCWHIGKISVRDIVSRPGMFSADRIDVDVSLSIDQADIRVRRAGLDLDPGWLPWFGRVVRFHYLFEGDFHV